jgi:hypothetical protein
MYILTIVGFPLVSTLPVLLGLECQAATFPFCAALPSCTIGAFWAYGFVAPNVARMLGPSDAAVPA